MKSNFFSSLFISLLWVQFQIPTALANDGTTCQLVFNQSQKSHEMALLANTELQRLKSLSPSAAWNETYHNMNEIQSAFVGEGLEPIFFSLMVGAIAKEFVWINGDPGGAKTGISKVFYTNLLLGLPYENKKNFFIQFNKLMTENVITGTPKIKSMLKGLYERNFEQSLVNESFRTFIADEVEKSHTGLQASLLSLLAERAVFTGDQIVKAGIETGVFTSNKTTGQLMESYGLDAPTGEALLDRMALKTHAVNKQLDIFSQLTMYKKIQEQKVLPPLPLPIAPIRNLLNSVVIPDSVLSDFAQIGNQYDSVSIDKREKSLDAQMDPNNEVPPYFPANQFSNRSWRKILTIAKASFIAEQLMDGVPFEQIRFKMERQDLHHIATAAVYNGPGRLQKKSIVLSPIQIFTSMISIKTFEPIWNLEKNEILLKEQNGTSRIRLNIDDAKNSFTIRSYQLNEDSINDINQNELFKQLHYVLVQAKKDEKNKNLIENPKGFVVDPVFNKYLALSNLPKETRAEIGSILEDHKKLVRILNDQLEKPIDNTEVTKNIRSARAQQLVDARNAKKSFKIISQTPENVKPETMWPLTQKTVHEVLNTFPEMKHVVKSILLALASDSNAFLFGPPGGAKTAISRALIDAELKTENQLGVAVFINRFLKKYEQDYPKEFNLFMLQCHQLLPEGQIVGFQNIDSQLEKDGKLEWNTENSLAGRTFLYAIIDEAEKAHSAVTATMLSIMQEREVYYGAYTVKATLLAMVLTSNKTPSEFLEMFDIKDQPTGKAMLDRSPIKAYVPNKFANENILVDYLAKLKSGFNPVIHGPLGVNYLKPIIEAARDRMLKGSEEHGEAPNDRVALVGLKIAQLFDSEQLKKEERSVYEHSKEPIEFPNFYIRANSGSNRSVGKLFDIWISAKVTEQLLDGVPYNQIQTQLTFKDLGILAQALTYAGPYEILAKSDQNGFLFFELDSHTLDQMIASGRVDSRNMYTLKYIRDEANTFVQIMNSVLTEYQTENREEIQKYPHLFPEIKLNLKQISTPVNRG